MITTKSVKCV